MCSAWSKTNCFGHSVGDLGYWKACDLSHLILCSREAEPGILLIDESFLKKLLYNYIMILEFLIHSTWIHFNYKASKKKEHSHYYLRNTLNIFKIKNLEWQRERKSSTVVLTLPLLGLEIQTSIPTPFLWLIYICCWNGGGVGNHFGDTSP